MLVRKYKDFIKLFDEACKNMRSMNIIPKTAEICTVIANSAAPRFYVTTEEALMQYNLYKRGLSNIKRVERRKMYAEIFSRYESLLEASNGCSFKYSIMEQVLKQPAPCFYILDDYAQRFYYRAFNFLRKHKV